MKKKNFKNNLQKKKKLKKKITKKIIFRKTKTNNNNKILMHKALLPNLKKIGLHLWQLLQRQQTTILAN